MASRKEAHTKRKKESQEEESPLLILCVPSAPFCGSPLISCHYPPARKSTCLQQIEDISILTFFRFWNLPAISGFTKSDPPSNNVLL